MTAAGDGALRVGDLEVDPRRHEATDNVVTTRPEEHDRAVARTSHVPQVPSRQVERTFAR